MRRIYLDLDNTLIDSVSRYKEEQEVAERYGVPRAEYVRAVEALYARHGPASYSFPLLFSLICEAKQDASEALLRELEALLRKQYFFPDTLAFLARFPREELVLVTEGVPEFQWPKIRAHDILRYVGRVELIAGKKSCAISEEGGATVFFVDDAARHVDEVKRARPRTICIQVRAAAPWEKKQNALLADALCGTLIEAADFIEARSREGR